PPGGPQRAADRLSRPHLDQAEVEAPDHHAHRPIGAGVRAPLDPALRVPLDADRDRGPRPALSPGRAPTTAPRGHGYPGAQPGQQLLSGRPVHVQAPLPVARDVPYLVSRPPPRERIPIGADPFRPGGRIVRPDGPWDASIATRSEISDRSEGRRIGPD